MQYRFVLCLALFLSNTLQAQIPRERASQDGPVEEVFGAPNVILTSSVYNLPEGNLNATIMHSFGIVTSGASILFGLDDAANIRFGVDYGTRDRLSIAVDRSRFDKLYDVRFKANVLRQTIDDRSPLEVALKEIWASPRRKTASALPTG